MESLRKIKGRDYGRLIISANSAHIPLRGPAVSLGRCARCAQLVVTGETISRCHCRILAVHDAVYIEDLNSRNGTWLNGTRISLAPLVNGAVLHLGQEQFVFETSLKFSKLRECGLCSLAVQSYPENATFRCPYADA